MCRVLKIKRQRDDPGWFTHSGCNVQGLRHHVHVGILHLWRVLDDRLDPVTVNAPGTNDHRTCSYKSIGNCGKV